MAYTEQPTIILTGRLRRPLLPRQSFVVNAYTPLVGQFSKRESIDAYARPLFWCYLIVLLCIAILAFFSGLFFGKYISPLLWCAIMMVMYFGGRIVIKMADQRMDAASKRRVELLRGGQAEVYVSMLFRDNLDDKWHLFDNLKLDANSDIDHVLVGPAGIFVISTKSQRGLFQSGPQHNPPHFTPPHFNLQPTNWCQDAISQALRLRTILLVLIDDPKATPPWIQAVLALPFAHIDTSSRDPETDAPTHGKCWVLHEDNLIDYIMPDNTSGNDIPKSRRLNKREIDRWVTVLKTLQRKQNMGDY